MVHPEYGPAYYQGGNGWRSYPSLNSCRGLPSSFPPLGNFFHLKKLHNRTRGGPREIGYSHDVHLVCISKQPSAPNDDWSHSIPVRYIRRRTTTTKSIDGASVAAIEVGRSVRPSVMLSVTLLLFCLLGLTYAFLRPCFQKNQVYKNIYLRFAENLRIFQENPSFRYRKLRLSASFWLFYHLAILISKLVKSNFRLDLWKFHVSVFVFIEFLYHKYNSM